MRAALISQGSLSSKWIAEEMKKIFDDVDVLDIKDFEVSLGGSHPEVSYEGKPITKEYDCIYAKGSYRYVTLLRSLTTILGNKAYMPIRPGAFTAGHDKLLTHLKLQAANIPQPQTWVVSTAHAAKKLLKKIEYPVVMKLPAGTHGKGVMLADTAESASSMIDALALLKQPFLLQEYVETNGTDTRAFVVGDEVVACMKRTAAEGEKRANIHSGGSAIACEIDEHAKQVALETARAVGADICAVDLLIKNKKPMVIEINLSPGLQAITRATKINIAHKIAKYLHTKAKEFKMKQAGLALVQVVPDKEVITKLDFRGSRILLPEAATSLSKLTSQDDVSMTVSKGKITLKKGEEQ